MRFTRRAVLPGSVAALVATGITVFALARGDEEPPTAPETPTATDTSAPTATPDPNATPEHVTELTRVSVSKGGTVQPGYGLLLGNGLTGGAEVWLLPKDLHVSGVSPSGRYFVAGDELIDGWTGTRTRINDGPEQIAVASFSHADGMVYLQTATLGGRIIRLDGTEVVRLPAFEDPVEGPGSQLNAVWTADGRGFAVARVGSKTARTDVVVDGALREPIVPGGLASWSNTGLRLAVAVRGGTTTLVDYEAGSTVVSERGGSFPAWSDDDRYIALDLTAGEDRALSVLDTVDGSELLRVYNSQACFDLYWRGTALRAGTHDAGIAVPSGEVVAGPPLPEVLPSLRFGQDSGNFEWFDKDGVYAEVSVNFGWAFSFAWTRRDVDQWPPAVYLGSGGKGACYPPSEPPVVVFPPFTDDKIPTAVPTRTH